MHMKRVARTAVAVGLLGAAIAVIFLPLSPIAFLLSIALCESAWFVGKGVPTRIGAWLRVLGIQLFCSACIALVAVFWIGLASQGFVKGPGRFEFVKGLYFDQWMLGRMAKANGPSEIREYAGIALELSEKPTGERARELLKTVPLAERFSWAGPEYLVGLPILTALISYTLRRQVKRGISEGMH